MSLFFVWESPQFPPCFWIHFLQCYFSWLLPKSIFIGLLGFWLWVFLALLSLTCHPFCIIMWPFQLDLAFPRIFFSFYFIEAVFSEYLKPDTPIQLHVAYGCFWAMATVRIVVTETVWPTKPKIFTVWHFAKKFCRSLAWRDSWIPIPAPGWMAGECLQLLLHFLVPTGLFSQFASALWRWWSSVSTARLSHSLHQWFR